MRSMVCRLQRFIPWCRRNILLPVTLFFMLGTICGRKLIYSLSETSAGLMFILLALLSLLLYYRRKQGALLLTLPLFFLAGYLNTIHRIQAPESAGHIHSLINGPTRATLVGTVASMVEQGEETCRFELKSREILLHGARSSWQPVHGRVQLSTRARIEDLQPGEQVMLLTTLKLPENYQTPGTFDYTTYLAAKNITVTGWINGNQDIRQVLKTKQSDSIQLAYLPEQIRQQVAEFLRHHLDPELSGLYQALLIGSRAEVAPRILENFKASGTMHLLAISGLHMGLLALMAGTLLNRLLRRSGWLLLHTHVPSLALLGTAPLLLGYGFIAGMNPPVLRALVMAFVLLTAVLVRRQHSPLHLVAAAALLMLTINPLVLFTASFQLSFSAVTGIALFLPQLVAATQPGSKEPATWEKLYGYAKAGLLVSLTATAATMPFMLLHFNRFSTVGPIMNLLIEPLLCLWALPWGLTAIPMISFAPQVATLFLNIGGLGISAAQYCTEAAAAIPFASLWTITPTPTEALFYGLLFFLWRLRSNSPRDRLFVLVFVLLGGGVLFLHFTWALWFPVKPSMSRVSYLDIGQGTSSFLHMPDGLRILIDGGGTRSSRFNVGERIIAPFLWEKRIWRLDQVVITHPHSDHFNGLDFILDHFRPSILILNGDERSEGKYGLILQQAKLQGVGIKVAQKGDTLASTNAFRLRVLGMGGLLQNRQVSVNDASLVLRYTHGRRSFLFPGDISAASEDLLVGNRVELRADVLLAAHHGSVTSNSTSFMDAVSPSIIIVSAGENGRDYYPHPTRLALWRKRQIPTLVTREQGTITCSTDGSVLRCTPSAAH